MTDPILPSDSSNSQELSPLPSPAVLRPQGEDALPDVDEFIDIYKSQLEFEHDHKPPANSFQIELEDSVDDLKNNVDNNELEIQHSPVNPQQDEDTLAKIAAFMNIYKSQLGTEQDHKPTDSFQIELENQANDPRNDVDDVLEIQYGKDNLIEEEPDSHSPGPGGPLSNSELENPTNDPKYDVDNILEIQYDKENPIEENADTHSPGPSYPLSNSQAQLDSEYQNLEFEQDESSDSEDWDWIHTAGYLRPKDLKPFRFRNSRGKKIYVGDALEEWQHFERTIEFKWDSRTQKVYFFDLRFTRERIEDEGEFLDDDIEYDDDEDIDDFYVYGVSSSVWPRHVQKYLCRFKLEKLERSTIEWIFGCLYDAFATVELDVDIFRYKKWISDILDLADETVPCVHLEHFTTAFELYCLGVMMEMELVIIEFYKKCFKTVLLPILRPILRTLPGNRVFDSFLNSVQRFSTPIDENDIGDEIFFFDSPRYAATFGERPHYYNIYRRRRDCWETFLEPLTVEIKKKSANLQDIFFALDDAKFLDQKKPCAVLWEGFTSSEGRSLIGCQHLDNPNTWFEFFVNLTEFYLADQFDPLLKQALHRKRSQDIDMMKFLALWGRVLSFEEEPNFEEALNFEEELNVEDGSKPKRCYFRRRPAYNARSPNTKALLERCRIQPEEK